MLTLDEIRKYLTKVARQEFGAKRLVKVLVEPYLPPEGDEGIGARIVLRSEDGYRLSVEQVRNMTRRANDFMVANSDSRFVYTHYATEPDLNELARVG